jgi:hypothetical protein
MEIELVLENLQESIVVACGDGLETRSSINTWRPLLESFKAHFPGTKPCKSSRGGLQSGIKRRLLCSPVLATFYNLVEDRD